MFVRNHKRWVSRSGSKLLTVVGIIQSIKLPFHVICYSVYLQSMWEETLMFTAWTIGNDIKRLKVWLSVTKKYNNTVKYNTHSKDVLCKGESTFSIRKPLLWHAQNLKDHTMSNVLQPPSQYHTPNSSYH